MFVEGKVITTISKPRRDEIAYLFLKFLILSGSVHPNALSGAFDTLKKEGVSKEELGALYETLSDDLEPSAELAFAKAKVPKLAGNKRAKRTH